MRRRWLGILGLGLFAGVACDPVYDYGGSGNPNEIVFGISQDAKGVSADYEFIGIGGHGGSMAAAFRDGDGEGACWFENLDDRLGKAHVDNGTARWNGGTLGTSGDGLLVVANQPAPTTQATAGWTSTDTLSFYAEGFAMPELGRVTMRAPAVELEIGAIAPAPDATNAITLTPSTDVSVTWTPVLDELASRVLVSLETPHANVRCFKEARAGSTLIPATWIAQLFEEEPRGDAGASSATISGRLTIASHRQATVIAPGNWLVYAVATAVHRDIAFTGTR